MDILLLGGPRFLGYALIEAALAGGHRITMFNRGRTNPQLFPEIERIQGDRDGGLGRVARSGERADRRVENVPKAGAADAAGFLAAGHTADRLRDAAVSLDR